MINLKKIFLYLIIICINLKGYSQLINGSIFGQNAWVPTVFRDFNTTPTTPRDFYPNSCSFCASIPPNTRIGNAFGVLDNYWPDIFASGVKTVRVGGIAVDQHPQPDWFYKWQILKIKYANHIPLCQVPIGIKGVSETECDASNAANLVTSINSNSSTYCKFWIVGNEPDGGGYTASEIFNKYSTFVPAMIAADPSIIIIGPELAGFNSALITSLTSGSTNILPYIDYFTFHYYPFGNEMNQASTLSNEFEIDATRVNVKNVLRGPNPVLFGNSAAVTTLNNQLIDLNSIIDNWNLNNSDNIKVGITEANICFKNDVNGTNPTVGTDLTAGGTSSNGFLAGQFYSEFLSVCMVNNVALTNFWSVTEGIADDNYESDIGYIGTENSGIKKSTYHHFGFIANNFNGNHILGNSNNSDIKVFGSKSCKGMSVIIMNQNQTGGLQDYVINLSGSLPSTGTFKANVNMGNSNIILTGNINQEETILYVMDACGKLKSKYTYNVGDNAPAVISGTGRFCRCYDFTTYNPSNSTAKCATPGGGTGHFNDDNLSKSFSLTGNVGSVTGTLKVTGNSVLTIQDAEMVFAPGAKIEVQPGSKLIIKNSYLHGCEGGQKWAGMDVKGNNILSGQISIDGSQIWDAQVAVKANNVKDISITGTSFHDGITAIEMERVQGFQISNNEIASFTYGIKTSKTIMSSAAIKENYFYDVKYAVFSESDNHLKLDITCNKFEKYSDYAIYSDNSMMKDQGSLSNGAGNEFISNSTQLNHKLRHNGNPMNYYYDPSNPVSLNTSSGLKAIAQMAGADGTCSSASARLLDNTSEKENSSETSKSLLENAFDFNVYPNPFNNSFIVTTNSTNASLLEIYNVYGSLIYSVNPENEQTEITLDKYTSGVYFVKMSNHQGSVIKKIIKE